MPEDAQHRSQRPLYRQIADQIRDAIRQEKLGPGNRLPSEIELAATHAVGVDTVRSALLVLRTEGLVDTVHGSGTFVRIKPEATPAPEDTDERHAVEITCELVQDAPTDVLRFFPETITRFLRRHRAISVDERVVQLATSWMSLYLVRDTALLVAEPVGRSFRMVYEDDLGLVIAPYDETVSARMPTPEEQADMELPPGTPVLVVEKALRTTDGQAVEYARVIYDSNFHVLSYRVG